MPQLHPGPAGVIQTFGEVSDCFWREHVDSLEGRALRLFEPGVKIVVLECPAITELAEFERQRQALTRVLLGEMSFHDIENTRANFLSCGLGPAGSDLQDRMNESGIGLTSVGDAKLLAANGPHSHAARREDGLIPDAQSSHVLRKLAAQMLEIPARLQVAAVFKRHVRHQAMLMVAMVQPTEKIGIGR
jgi:hypothetical protein